MTPLKSIRMKCLDCCCGSSAEVKRCDILLCPLHQYRFGHRPTELEGRTERPEKQEDAGKH